MKKLKLNLDDIKVESFETSANNLSAVGTVKGNATLTEYVTCNGCTHITCGNTCGNTCNGNTCDGNTCDGTCDGNTCDGTCNVSCFGTCNDTCDDPVTYPCSAPPYCS